MKTLNKNHNLSSLALFVARLLLISMPLFMTLQASAKTVLAQMIYKKDEKVLGLFQLKELKIHSKKILSWQKEVLTRNVLPHFMIAKKRWYWPMVNTDPTAIKHTHQHTQIVSSLPSMKAGVIQHIFNREHSDKILGLFSRSGITLKSDPTHLLTLQCRKNKSQHICDLISSPSIIFAMSVNGK
jgi:hypothetical protein